LWLFGSRWCFSSSVAGREIRKPILERSELVKARRRRSVTKRAVPSSDLSAMLPEKPSVTTTSTSPREILSPSMKPFEAHAEIVRLAQDCGGVLELVGSLQFLGADVEELHPRPFEVEHHARIGRAHHRELDEVAGVGLGVRAEIEHHEVVVAEGREQRGERRPVDPGMVLSASLAIAIIAPVFPAETAACASPDFTAAMARPIEVVFARRIAWLGLSSAAMVSGVWTSSAAAARSG
jgi:hypothetical protein